MFLGETKPDIHEANEERLLPPSPFLDAGAYVRISFVSTPVYF